MPEVKRLRELVLYFPDARPTAQHPIFAEGFVADLDRGDTLEEAAVNGQAGYVLTNGKTRERSVIPLDKALWWTGPQDRTIEKVEVTTKDPSVTAVQLR